MKKQTILAGLLLAASTSFAQVKVASNGYTGIGVGNTIPLTKFQIGDIWTFYDGGADKEICRNARYASMQYWRIKTGASSLISFDVDGNILFKTSPSCTSCTSGTAITNWSNVIIKNNGSIGLGTTSPLAKLEIISEGDPAFSEWNVNGLQIRGTNHALYMGVNSTSGVSYIQSVHVSTTQKPLLLNARGGNVIIGRTTPTTGYLLDVNGKIYASGSITSSDERLKSNIKNVTTETEKLYKLQGKSYTKTLEPTDMAQERDTTTFFEYGYLAQELKEVFPELVSQDTVTGYYGVNYVALIPVIVEALKDQRKVIDKQQQRIEQLEKGCVAANTLKSLNTNDASAGSIGSTGSLTTSSATTAIQEMHLSDNSETGTLKLYQNAPNPFNERTVIQCFVPQNIQKAQLCVYNMKGIRVQCLSITERGTVEIHIEAGALSAGVYSYVLIGDGAASDTKQMILTK